MPSVAIIGASADPSKFGNQSLRAHRAQGYDVYPVNPKGGEIEGLPVYSRLADVPLQRLDRVSMYVPPEVGLALLDEIAAHLDSFRRAALFDRLRDGGAQVWLTGTELAPFSDIADEAAVWRVSGGTATRL